MHNNIVINDANEGRLMKELQSKKDVKSERIKRLLAMPDLSRKDGSPLKALIDKVFGIKEFIDFDNIIIPEIISTKVLFDLFDFPENHPARSQSDTYYLDDENVLRTHDTVFWYYYLNYPEIKKMIEKNQSFGTFCYGKVYRKDEIDRHHMNVFHQMGGLYLVPDKQKKLTLDDLKNDLTLIVKSIFGPDVHYKFTVETFPYTDPSLEVEVEINGTWIEILGGGMPRKNVLANFGLKGYNGWAFGFGLERLAIIKMDIPDIRIFWSNDPRITSQLRNLDSKYKEVSRYPAVNRDISFVIDKGINLNNYYELVRDEADNLIEEVQLVDQYEDESKWPGKKSHTFRIVYRSLERTLTNEEINRIHEQIVEKTKQEFKAEIR